MEKFIRMGVDYLGFLSKQLGDLRGIATLAYELIQNADDAKDESGALSATQITFDIKDEALIVSNDAVFREIDFERMQNVASGSKRGELGDRTTGAFGVGFISVYQVTDRPEIRSAGRRWILRPDKREDKRIRQDFDPSITKDKGTVFRLPWAFDKSEVRTKLKVPPVGQDAPDQFVKELKNSLPKAILFLKKLQKIELLRNGKRVIQVTKIKTENMVKVNCNGVSQNWRVMQGTFENEALELKRNFRPYIEDNREAHVQIAIPNTLLADGLLFATLPTEQSTGLPFHIDADFFPASDRKSIAFEDTNIIDPRSKWNRTAIREAASVVEANLISLRDMFKNDASTFWAILDSLNRIYQKHTNDKRKPFGEFWEVLRPHLQTSENVYTESGKWLTPAETRIPTGTAEEEAVPVVATLAIEVVHRDLWKYRNILTSGNVGVQRLRIKDIYESFENMGLVGHPQPIPSYFQTPKKLEQLWKGICGILRNTFGQSTRAEAVKLLRRCALAPGLDGCLWPCGSGYQADEYTRKIFTTLIPADVSFLVVEGIPLLEELCPKFRASSAIKELERLDTEKLQRAWREDHFDPATVLKWFDGNKKELSENKELPKRLAKIPLFPSTKKLCSLENLHLPGGFSDPIGVANLVDMRQLKGLSDFLKFLGAEELTFIDYAERYIPEAFDANKDTSLEAKCQLLDILATRIGEVRENDWIRAKLAGTNIVECTDGEFRQPKQVYFQRSEVSEIFGDFVYYVHLPEKSEGRKDLYGWMGIASRPRSYDVLRYINKLTDKPPNQNSIQAVKRVLEALGNTWDRIPDNKKQSYGDLKNKKWLLAEGPQDKWYKPDQIYAAYNKSLFESQAKFLDIPIRIQQKINDFLRYLGVNLSPQPIQVVHHLLRCSKLDREPPRGIYQWLNNNIEHSHDSYQLKNFACLRIQGRYRRPDEVFWGQHSFGRFRVQLGADFRSYQNLLQALDIKEVPDHSDAFKVLMDISKKTGNNRLKPKDEDVVTHCWIMLAEALQSEHLDSADIQTRLCGIRCVPNLDNILYLPSRIFFDDRPGLADKFSKPLEKHRIPRKEIILQALEAAGVRPISDIVIGSIDKSVNSQEDKKLEAQVTERAGLIKTISNDAVQLDSIRFLRTDQLKVKWSLNAFGRDWSPTSPEPVEAYLDRDDQAIYFVLRNGKIRPWSAIARELTQLIAPGKEIGSISPGLKMVLEADTYEEAVEQLNDLGIALTEELRNPESKGKVAETFDEKSSGEHQESSASSQNGTMSNDGVDKTHQDELDDKDDMSSHTSNTTSNSTDVNSSSNEKSVDTGRSDQDETGQERGTEDDIKNQSNSNGTGKKESNRSNGQNRPRPETGQAAENWLEKKLEQAFPNRVQRHVRDKENRESDFVVSSDGREFHIEVKHVKNLPGTIYWTGHECDKAQNFQRNCNEYFMAVLSYTGDSTYKILWIWDPLKKLKRTSREVEWAGESSCKLKNTDSWDVETRRPDEVPTKRHKFLIKLNDETVKGFKEDTEDLKTLCRKIENLKTEREQSYNAID